MFDDDDGLEETLAKGFNEGEEQETPPAATPPVTDPPKPADPATPPAPAAAEPPKAEEPKKDEQPPAPKEGEEATPPADPAKKPEEGAEPPKAPETPPAPADEQKPLTKDDVTSILRDIRTEERTSGVALETAAKDVLKSYYPDGLSNVLTTPEGKELRTPQDVIDASGGTMSSEEATNWLLNEQYKLDQDIKKIEGQARDIAETTLNFRKDAITAVEKYAPLFEKYPQLQKKVYDSLMRQTKVDVEKNVVLSAPDVLQHYDDYLDPYRLAFEHETQTAATAPTDPATPPAPAPSADDRLDEGGDGGQSVPNNPDDFAQQVGKELAKGEV